VTCAHCGSSLRIPEDDGEHFCMGFLFDWLEAEDGEHRMRDFGEVVALMGELGI
jgi:hypothetical protein